MPARRLDRLAALLALGLLPLLPLAAQSAPLAPPPQDYVAAIGLSGLKNAFAAVGAFAVANDTSRDAAIELDLPPGAYTATVSGKNNTTGVALVEVYELP